VRVLVHLEVGVPQDGAGVRAAAAAQQRLQPGGHLADAERLRHVVVAAQRESGDLVVRSGAGGQEQDGEPVAVPPEPADDLEPVDIGQHDVEDGDGGPELGGRAQRRHPRAGRGHLEARETQRRHQQLGDVRIVVHHQQALTGRPRRTGGIGHEPPPRASGAFMLARRNGTAATSAETVRKPSGRLPAGGSATSQHAGA
jgi:hypothetical protein